MDFLQLFKTTDDLEITPLMGYYKNFVKRIFPGTVLSIFEEHPGYGFTGIFSFGVFKIFSPQV